MHKPVTKIRPLSQLRRFQRSDEGSFTLEAVIWMPIFAILLAIIMNLSMVFYYESQMLRVAQDATRAYSMAKFAKKDDPKAFAETYIRDRLPFLSADTIVEVNELDQPFRHTQTIISTNAKNLMPFELMSGPFANVPIGVSTQFIIEQ